MDAAHSVGNAARHKVGGSEGEMERAISAWLMVLVPCGLVYTEIARARDLPPVNVAESSPAIEDSLFDPNPTVRAQFYSPPNVGESPSVIELQRNAADSPLNASSASTARAQYLPPPNPADVPIFVQRQHVAVSSSGDADSLGNRNAYVDGTFAPFSGIYESGARFRLTGNASWYKFVTSEDPRTLGSGRYLEGGLLVGYGVWVPGFNITWLVGPAFGESVNEGVVTDRWGVKAALEMYARPTDLTMASASVTYSTIGNNLQVQTKAGLKIFGDVYFGPEAKFFWQQILPFQINFSTPAIATTTPVSAQQNIATTRVGAHISALTVGPVFVGISGGWAHDRQLGSGYYGSVSFYQSF
jgi:Cellulose biosynthesis protein BcsS